jgi:hypothetical protein
VVDVRTVVVRNPEGAGEVLVTLLDGGGVIVATRAQPSHAWGPPWTVVADEGTVATIERGTSLEYEPEDREAISSINFEEDPPENEPDRQSWMVEAMGDVLLEVGLSVPESKRYLQLQLNGEELAWFWVEELVNTAGFDTYNSDSRFEVFVR